METEKKEEKSLKDSLELRPKDLVQEIFKNQHRQHNV